MMCTPGSCGSRAAQLTNLAAPFWFRSDLGAVDTLRRREVGKSCKRHGTIGWWSQIEPAGPTSAQFSRRSSTGDSRRSTAPPRRAHAHTGGRSGKPAVRSAVHGHVRNPTNSKRRRPDFSGPSARRPAVHAPLSRLQVKGPPRVHSYPQSNDPCNRRCLVGVPQFRKRETFEGACQDRKRTP